MPIHQIPARVIKLDGKLPPFPATVEICAELVPEELFGKADLTGRLGMHPAGGQAQATADMYHGGIRLTSRGRLPPPKVATSFFDMNLVLEGNIARVSGRLDAEPSFPQLVHAVAAHLPGFLACALSSPVDIKDLFGNVGEAFFTVEVKGTFYKILRVPDLNRELDEHMTAISKVSASVADRVFAAQRYINQAQWLGYAARHPQEFAGERLLNLNKVLELLYPHGDKVDNLRAALTKTGLRREVVELFASIVYVRNSIDVGHAKIGFMTAEEQHQFHMFLQYATELVTWLTRYTVGAWATVPQRVQSPTMSPSSISKTMERIGELMQNVDPLKPHTFFKEA